MRRRDVAVAGRHGGGRPGRAPGGSLDSRVEGSLFSLGMGDEVVLEELDGLRQPCCRVVDAGEVGSEDVELVEVGSQLGVFGSERLGEGQGNPFRRRRRPGGGAHRRLGA
jgi:hypothetical protein